MSPSLFWNTAHLQQVNHTPSPPVTFIIIIFITITIPIAAVIGYIIATTSIINLSPSKCKKNTRPLSPADSAPHWPGSARPPPHLRNKTNTSLSVGFAFTGHPHGPAIRNQEKDDMRRIKGSRKKCI